MLDCQKITSHYPTIPTGLALCLSGFFVTAAHAQTAGCGNYELIARYLLDKHGETVALALFKQPDAVYELFMDAEDESWSIVQRFADGTACLRAVGVGYLDQASILVPQRKGNL